MLEFHRLADIVPLIEGDEFRAFVDDIREHGLNEPIVLYEGKILDGRNRYRGCQEAGREPKFREFEGDYEAARAFVISENIKRRHLDESQRAMAAAKMANMPHGGDRSSGQLAGCSQEQAAKLFNVGDRSVRRAVVVRDSGCESLISRTGSRAGRVPQPVRHREARAPSRP
jgi:ParB-like chromosome segregation protein Spo0J